MAVDQFSGVINVDDLDGSNGFRIVGAAPGDAFGWSVTGAVDVNGDRLSDLIITAPSARDTAGVPVGKGYVVYGQNGNLPAVLNASDIAGSLGFTIQGATSSGTIGSSVASGDFNGDGRSDVFVGGRTLSFDGTASGGAYVLFGQAGGAYAEGGFNLRDLDGSNGFLVRGFPAGASAGFAVGVSDLNGDGKEDVVVGAVFDPSNGTQAGGTYVIYGTDSALAAEISVADLDESAGFMAFGVEEGERSGFALAGGDFNGDGYSDLVIGAPNGDDKGPNTGGAYVLFGSASGPSETTLDRLDGSTGFRIAGVEASTRAGWTVDAGDVNGDGVDDIIVGLIDGEPNEIHHAGATFVLYGSTEARPAVVDLAQLAEGQGFEIRGYAYQQESGSAVASAGDINGDGINDILIGAQHGDPGGNTFPSSAFVVFGRAGRSSSSIDLADLDGSNGFRIDHTGYGAQLGVTVSAAGDVNGDGYDDIVVGQRYDIRLDSYSKDPGSAYVVYGHSSAGPVLAPTNLNFTGTVVQDNVMGDAGSDHFDMRQGGDDFVFGGRGDDTFDLGESLTSADMLDGGKGFDTLMLEGDYALSLALLQGTVNNMERIFVAPGHNYSIRPGYNTVLAGQVMIIDGSALGASDKLTVTAPKASAFGDVMEGSLILYGGRGSDKLAGGLMPDEIHGGDGADTLTASAGDSVYGDAGDDYVFVDDVTARVFESAGMGRDRVLTSVDYTLATGQEIELLSTKDAAGSSSIRLNGNEFGQYLYGNVGANILDGRGGADTMFGYEGDDTYYVDTSADRVIEADSAGFDKALTTVSFTLSSGQSVEVLSARALAGLEALTLNGNELSQKIVGNAGANSLDGRGGGDVLQGLGGDDLYYIHSSADRVLEIQGGGNDRILTSVSLSLSVGQEIEMLTTRSLTGLDAVRLVGNEFDQKIVGNAGDNQLDGMGGVDVLQGLGGNDLYYVDNAADRVIEAVNAGNDRVLASVSFALAAGQEIEMLSTRSTAGTQVINLTGNEFDQRLAGNAGSNVLDGKGGSDLLQGLGGADTFVFSTAFGSVDHIRDLDSDDHIGLSRSIFTALSGEVLTEANFKDIGVAGASVDADDLIIYNSKTGSLVYDMDGGGSTSAVQFAVLDNHAAVSAATFFVV